VFQVRIHCRGGQSIVTAALVVPDETLLHQVDVFSGRSAERFVSAPATELAMRYLRPGMSVGLHPDGPREELTSMVSPRSGALTSATTRGCPLT